MHGPAGVLRPKITIMKVDGTEDYFVHDAFSPSASGARIIARQTMDAYLTAILHCSTARSR
jgi:hypothetical protein